MTPVFRTFVAALALASAPALLPTRPASADPYTAHFDALQSALQTRYDALTPDSPVVQARERRAAAVALALLARPSTSLAADLRLLASVAQRIEVPAADTVEIQTALDAAADALEAEVTAVRAAAAVGAQDVLFAPIAARFPRMFERINADLDVARDGATVTLRARALLRAHRLLGNVGGLIAKANACRGRMTSMGRGYVATRVNGGVLEARSGGAVATLDPEGAVTNVLVLGFAGETVNVRIEWATGVFAGVGTYDVTAESGVFVSVDAGSGSLDAVQGVVLVSGFDAAARRISGRFDVRLADGSVVSAGRFNVCRFATETLP